MTDRPDGSCYLLGATISIAAAFPAAALVALVHGFPVPFVGKLQGPDAMVPAMYAVFMYGLMGGFVVLLVGGSLAGLAAERLNRDASSARTATTIAALAISVACVLLVATLDLLIGPW